MTKQIFSAFLLVLLLFSVVVTSVAATKSSVYGMNYVTSFDQYYSVFFDEEGEAFVALRLDITNRDNEAIELINVEIPGQKIQVLNVLEGTYNYNKIEVVPVRFSNSINLPIDIECLSKDERTQVLIIYKVDGYVDDIVGLSEFSFETAKVPYMSNSVRVSVNVQDGLHLKDGKSKVNYLPNFEMLGGASFKASATMDEGVRSLSDNIMYESGFVKSASYLDPHESFTVKGRYSESYLRLYVFNVLGYIAGGLLLLFAIIYGFKKLVRKIKAIKFTNQIKSKKNETQVNYAMPLFVGFYTVLFLSILWIITIFFIGFIDNILSYSVGPIFSFLIVMLSVFLTLACLIGVPIYIGVKYGMVQGFFTVVTIFGWSFIFSVFVVIVLSMFGSGRVFY